MDSYRCVTTCSAHGWAVYGEAMLRSWERRWLAEGRMLVYAEDFNLSGFDRDRIEQMVLPAWCDDFRNRNATRKRANGKNGDGGQYSFRYDALRFAFKTAAVVDAAERGGADWLIWIDADCLFHDYVTNETLEHLLEQSVPPGKPAPHVAWLDREMLYPECGFYFLRISDPLVQNLIGRWRALYESDKVFRLEEWHDSYVLEMLVIADSSLRIGSLSGPEGRKTTHPAVNGPLGAFLDHRKGPRKVTGPRKGDLRVERQEPYWQERRKTWTK